MTQPTTRLDLASKAPRAARARWGLLAATFAAIGWTVGCGSTTPPSQGNQPGHDAGSDTGQQMMTEAGGDGTMGPSSDGGSSEAALDGWTGDAGGDATAQDAEQTDGGPGSDAGDAANVQPTGDAGQPCNPDGTCAATLACVTNVCQPAGNAGEPCNPDGTCAASLACVMSVCQPAGDAGEPCLPPNNVCAAGLACYLGNCVASGDAGEPCTPPSNGCAAGLYCNNISQLCQVSYCTGKPQKALPYAISSDFSTVFTIGPEKGNLTVIQSGADCDSMSYPPIPNTGLGGPAPTDDAGNDAGYAMLGDGGVETVTYASVPPCYEFLFDPSCTSGLSGLCWAGAEFTNSAASAAAAPDGNPTASPVGVCLASGATEVTFWARASIAGPGDAGTIQAIGKFGSSRPGQCTSQVPITAADGGPPDLATELQTCPTSTEFYIALSTQWQEYTVALPANENYNDEPGAGGGVWNGFSLVLEPQYFVGGAYVFIKDIVWSNGNASATDAGSSDAASSDAQGGGDGAASDAGSSDAGSSDDASDAGAE